MWLSLTSQNVSSKTQDIKILSYSHYIDALGYLQIIGEIQNTGTDTIERVTLTATVYGPGGSTQGIITGKTWLSYMAPQQKSPFRLEIIEPTDYDNWYLTNISKIEISIKEAPESNKHLYSDFEITVNSAGISTSGNDKGAYWINGNVRNTGSQTASKLAVAAVFYNSSGCVVAIGRTDFLDPRTVSPSGTAPFRIGAYDYLQFEEPENRIIKNYALFVEAESPLIDGKAPTATTPATGSSDTTPNNPQPISNRRSTYIIIIAIVTITAIAALLLSRKSPPPKVETIQKKPTTKKHIFEKC